MEKISISESKGKNIKTKPLSPLKAIRRHCLSCTGRQPSEVRKCQSTDCALFLYRMGKNPNRAGIGVGIRAKNGQFQATIASPAGVSEGVVKSKGKDKAKANLINLGAASKKSGWPGVSVNKKGKVEIKGTEEGLLIKITND